MGMGLGVRGRGPTARRRGLRPVSVPKDPPLIAIETIQGFFKLKMSFERTY